MTQRVTVQHLLDILEEIASSDLAEPWDNIGLMVGAPGHEVRGILVALDPTESILAEASAAGANLIITHHPLIFHPLKSVRTDQVVGRFLRKAMAEDMSVIGCHTNLDSAGGGVNDALALAVGLTDVQPLIPTCIKNCDSVTGADLPPVGLGRWGRLPFPMPGKEFIGQLHKTLALSSLAIAGPLPASISTVAVCGGSGSDLAEAAYAKGVQVYITGEVKHSTARWAEACDFCIIDAGHFATENPVVEALTDVLRQHFMNKKGWAPRVIAAKQQKNPFQFYYA
jgi:dinuclear metal center YbgI/SA1388 family protein